VVVGGGGGGGGGSLTYMYLHVTREFRVKITSFCSVAMTTDFLCSSKYQKHHEKTTRAPPIRTVPLGRPKSGRKIMFCRSFVLQRRLWPPQFCLSLFADNTAYSPLLSLLSGYCDHGCLPSLLSGYCDHGCLPSLLSGYCDHGCGDLWEVLDDNLGHLGSAVPSK
jgi:hypothetical protein